MGRKWKANIGEPSAGRQFLLASYDDPDVYYTIRKELEKSFSSIEYETDAFEASRLPSLYGFTPRRQARLISFSRPIGREELVDTRRRTIAIEERHQHDSRPLVELDPGYVAEYSVVRTAVVEDFHRIYLYGGIYAETLYYFERLAFRPTMHTPEFFREQNVVSAFNDIRIIHVTGSK